MTSPEKKAGQLTAYKILKFPAPADRDSFVGRRWLRSRWGSPWNRILTWLLRHGVGTVKPA